MKNIKLLNVLLLATSLFAISACTSNSGGQGGDTPAPSGDTEDEGDEGGKGEGGDSASEDKELTIQYFIDYNHADQDNPFYEVEWYSGTTIPEPTSKPACPDEAFPTFLGWSAHSLVDDAKDLWDFKKDKTELGLYYLAIYGIWVAK